MFKKLILMTVALFSLLYIVPVRAQESKVPEYNPLCWKEKDCVKARSQAGFSTTNLDLFFFKESPCSGGDADNQWGKCLAGSKAKTSIAFGGVRDFSDIGDFIVKNYNFAISVAAILAVIIIVMSGFQWTASGGNSEIISAAKKRIGNAIIGLFIAYGSFFILYTVNPKLTQFDSLKVWMLRPISNVPRFCYMIKDKIDPTESVFSLAPAPSGQGGSSSNQSPGEPNLTFSAVASSTSQNCGSSYFYKNGGSTTCYGAVCNSGVCTNINITDPNDNKFNCRPGSIFGKVTDNSLFKSIPCYGYESDPIAGDNNGEIYRVCDAPEGYAYDETGTSMHVNNADESADYFAFDAVNGLGSEECENGGKFLGYALGLEFNVNCSGSDSMHLVGKAGNDLGKKTGATTKKFSTENFYSAEELRQGATVFVDLSGFSEK